MSCWPHAHRAQKKNVFLNQGETFNWLWFNGVLEEVRGDDGALHWRWKMWGRGRGTSGELDQWLGWNKVLQPCVLMRWKLHLQGNVLDEIVGSIEDGGHWAVSRRRGEPGWGWSGMRMGDQSWVTGLWWSNTICHLSHHRRTSSSWGKVSFNSEGCYGLHNLAPNWTDSIPAWQSRDWVRIFEQVTERNGTAMHARSKWCHQSNILSHFL